jgi:glycosyltransferase involved in cell wall biosynthesis
MPISFRDPASPIVSLLVSSGTIAVVIPCHNEESTIADVVGDFLAVLPNAQIVVADNDSTDETTARALQAGARVIHESRKGKGFAVSRLFAAVEADCYLMVDGDGTYDPSVAAEMCRRVLEDGIDMVCGVRRTVEDRGVSGDEYRRGHALGNRIFSTAFSRLFRMPMTDVFSGYRAMSRRFVKSYLGAPQGFEIEIELNAHCYAIFAGFSEIDADYRPRPEESESKLRTYRDGWHIGRALLRLFRELRPVAAFSVLAVPCLMISIVLGLIALVPYLETGVVLRFPSLIASLAFAQAAVILMSIGFVVSRITLNRREVRRAAYLSHTNGSAVYAERAAARLP